MTPTSPAGGSQTKRRRRGEREIRSLLARTCPARCRSVYRTRIIRSWDREHPEAVREYGRRVRLRRRWKLYAAQHQGAEPYPDLRRRRRAYTWNGPSIGTPGPSM